MEAVKEHDEELGNNSSLGDHDNAIDDENGQVEREVQRQSRGRSFFNRFHRSNTNVSHDDNDAANKNDSDDEGSTHNHNSSARRHTAWTSLGSRKIRFASQRYSDLLNDEVRGIVATPLDADLCKPMGTGERFFRNIQNEVEDLVEENRPQFFRKTTMLRGEEEGDGEEGDGDRFGRSENDHGEDGDLGGSETSQMYRLQATRGAKDVGCCRRTLRFLSACINCGALTQSATEQNLYLGFGDPNRWLIYFFFWLFRKGWSTVIVLSVVWYYSFVLFFALLIVWAAEIDIDCVRIGGKRFGDLENRSKFMDSFSLSWNTFSTVGYGSTYPALSGESEGTDGMDGRCAFISFITSFEALVGVVFAGFIGAIFYAKVSRITQRADVLFSDPLTVRFGTGVDTELGVEDDEENVPQNEVDNESLSTSKKKEKGDDNLSGMTPIEKFRSLAKKAISHKPPPFPVITFRIANEMHDTLGGEIIGASVNAVVLIESTKYDDQVSEDLAKQIALHRMKRSNPHTTPGAISRKASVIRNNRLYSNDTDSERETVGTQSERLSDRTSDSLSLDEDISSPEKARRASSDSAMTYLQSLNMLAYKARFGTKKMKIDEEECTSSKIVPRMVFTKLELETSEHPLFKRIWRFKHIINPDSPLLTSEAQKAIMHNNGNWPREWNNHKAVRKAIRFNQMVVSFTGISNISGASVYKQKVYDYVDTVVGYQFVNALYRGRRGNLKVDLRLINDVAEQTGGGGEPLHVTGKGSVRDV
mmetsp:Transcript_1771/g.3928  ORF Transcript_1771/g.3928 Transcript_1771/m.3928 type:complete len:759 (-) Transcript_1771:433-2709(-)